MIILGEDYSSGPYYITLAAGITRISFNVSILDDKILEEDEKFILTIDPSSLPCSVTTGDHNQATVIILEDECKGIILQIIYVGIFSATALRMYMNIHTYVCMFIFSKQLWKVSLISSLIVILLGSIIMNGNLLSKIMI